MFLGLDDLGQHGELLGSQNLCKFAIERGWHHFMASEWALGWLSSPLFPARVPWESPLWTTLHLCPGFLSPWPPVPKFCFQYWSGLWKHWGWMKPPWDPSWGSARSKLFHIIINWDLPFSLSFSEESTWNFSKASWCVIYSRLDAEAGMVPSLL